jgi:hypothetical protein
MVLYPRRSPTPPGRYRHVPYDWAKAKAFMLCHKNRKAQRAGQRLAVGSWQLLKPVRNSHRHRHRHKSPPPRASHGSRQLPCRAHSSETLPCLLLGNASLGPRDPSSSGRFIAQAHVRLKLSDLQARERTGHATPMHHPIPLASA